MSTSPAHITGAQVNPAFVFPQKLNVLMEHTDEKTEQSSIVSWSSDDDDDSYKIQKRGALEKSLEDALAILLVDDYADQEFAVVADEEQQRRRRPRGSDAYQRELLQDNAMKLLIEELSILDEDDFSSVGSSDLESSHASDDDDLDVFFETKRTTEIIAAMHLGHVNSTPEQLTMNVVIT